MEQHSKEVLQRVRRTETRVTQIAIAMGLDTQSQRPIFSAKDRRLTLPSIHCSWKELIAAVPEDWTGPLDLYIRDARVGVIAPEPRQDGGI